MDGTSVLTPEETGAHRRLMACLEEYDAVNADALMRRLRMDGDVVRGCLAGLVARGDVEILRPIGRGKEARRAPRRDDEFYRLVRETDNDYLWQQVAVPVAPTGEAENRGSERGVYRRNAADVEETITMGDRVFA
jgi:hypothetical protein